MLNLLARLRQKCAVGYVGGSDLSKQQEQLGTADVPVTTLFDFCFPENGLTAFKLGQPLPSTSFIKWIGEDQYKELVRFILHYIADLDIPVKRGTFIEFRNGMINVSPIGRNASMQERDDYNAYDVEHGIRTTFVEKLKERFSHLGLTCVFFLFLFASTLPPPFLPLASSETTTPYPSPETRLTFPPLETLASLSAARSRSTSSPRAGTRRTACRI